MAREIFQSLDELLTKYPEKPLGKAKDISGQTFNKLTAIKRVDKKTANTGSQWAFKCSCGNYIVTLSSQVMSGHTSSCGCYNKEIVKDLCQKLGKQSKSKDYTKVDNPFYEFVKPTTEKSGRSVVWEVKCKNCNKTYYSVPSQLISSTRRRGHNPCDCWKNTSKGVLKIKKLLDEANIPYLTEYKFEKCVSPKGNPMKFDFYINNQYLLEYDGEQHYSAQSFGSHEDEDSKLALTQEYDAIKNNYCIENNIPLIRIPYFIYSDLELKHLLLENNEYIIKKGKNDDTK